MRRKKRKNKIYKIIIILILGGGIFFIAKPFISNLSNKNEIIIEDNKNNNKDNSTNNNKDNGTIDNDTTYPNEISPANLTYDDVSILKTEDGTILERLETLSKQDKRIKEIIKNYDKYPENLLDNLSHNIEMVDFVYNYLDKKDKVYSEDIGNVTKDEVPLLMQWDARWGYGKYGSSNIAVSGCGPTSLAMVIAALTGKNDVTPYDVAKVAEEKGYYVNNSGTTWDLMRKGPNDFGIQSRELSLSKSAIFKALNAGHPVVVNLRKGDFTINGHYLVLAGIKDGKIKVNDPNSKIRSSILWEYERIESQIKNLWEFYI